jgi:hypothetical protein
MRRATNNAEGSTCHTDVLYPNTRGFDRFLCGKPNIHTWSDHTWFIAKRLLLHGSGHFSATSPEF